MCLRANAHSVSHYKAVVAGGGTTQTYRGLAPNARSSLAALNWRACTATVMGESLAALLACDLTSCSSVWDCGERQPGAG